MFTLGIIKSFKTVMCSVTPQDGEQVFHFIRHIWSQTFLFQSTIRSFYSAETLCAKCQQSSIKGVRCFMTSRRTIFHGILQRLKYLYPDALHFWKPTIIFLKNPSGGSVVCRLKLRCLAGVPGRWTLQKDNYTVWILKDKWAWEGAQVQSRTKRSYISYWTWAVREGNQEFDHLFIQQIFTEDLSHTK